MKRQLQPRNGKVKKAEIQESVGWLFFFFNPTFSQEYANNSFWGKGIQ